MNSLRGTLRRPASLGGVAALLKLNSSNSNESTKQVFSLRASVTALSSSVSKKKDRAILLLVAYCMKQTYSSAANCLLSRVCSLGIFQSMWSLWNSSMSPLSLCTTNVLFGLIALKSTQIIDPSPSIVSFVVASLVNYSMSKKIILFVTILEVLMFIGDCNCGVEIRPLTQKSGVQFFPCCE